MIFFMGKPLLSYLIASLKSNNLLDIVLHTSLNQVEAREYFSTGDAFGVNIKYHEGERWYGTAGTTKSLITQMDTSISNPFIVLYGDSLLKVDYQKILEFHIKNKSWLTVLYHRPNFESFLYEYHGKPINDEIRTNYGVMDVDSTNRITKIIEKPLIQEIKTKFEDPVASAAVYIINKETLDFVPSGCFFDFPKDLFPLLLDKGIPCFAFDIETGYRFDIGTIHNYYDTQLDILEGRIDFDFYFPLISEKIWVGNGSIIDSLENLKKPVLVCENSRIDLGTNIGCSIIGNNVYVGKFSSIRKSIVLDNVYIGNRVTISHSIIGENSFIEDDVFLPPNTVLGNYCRLGGLKSL